ncbi:hypothetical protein PG2022B_1697 [Bifidobacterium animalis subsp. animalis]|nr:hypothetical protein PG2022B_1697 [Bifidobacterium animalis subsp. animalis]
MAVFGGKAAARLFPIHTSPKGGDPFGDGLLVASQISIHTSPKGGDRH